ncbi:MAG: DUF4097 family beta strand repeat protein [Lachnospiraceae bacterium]|nr:DUF4097 family beta strand repeat protein [Lachnospiraceae bacterium]
MNDYNEKRLYTRVLTIVTIICIIIGFTYHIGGLPFRILGFNPFKQAERLSGGTDIATFSEDYDNISQIEVDCDIINLIIKEGDRTNISIESQKDMAPTVTSAGNVVSIKQNLSSSYRGDFKLSDLKDHICDVTITVPANGISQFSADVSLGEIDISDLNSLSVSIISNAGDISIDNLTSQQLTVDADMGNIEGSNISAATASFNADMGNVDISELSSNNLKAEVNMGNIEVSFANDIDDYNIALSTDVGNVSVNGKSSSKSFSQAGTGGNISIISDMGNISLE